jgi:type IV pilus assembly protein PilF
MRALIETALIEPQQATVDYREALNLAPHNPNILQDYGWFLCSHKHYLQSFPLFHQSLLDGTGDQTQKTYLALGVCQYRAGNLRQAIQTLTHGLAIFPGDPALQTNLAMALDRAGNASDALQRIRSVDYGSAATPESLWIGILIAHKLHDAQDAEQWSSQLNDHYPNNPWTELSKRRAYDDTSIFTY